MQPERECVFPAFAYFLLALIISSSPAPCLRTSGPPPPNPPSSSQELLSKLGVDPAAVADPKLCPVLSVIPRRTTVDSPAVSLPKATGA